MRSVRKGYGPQKYQVHITSPDQDRILEKRFTLSKMWVRS